MFPRLLALKIGRLAHSTGRCLSKHASQRVSERERRLSKRTTSHNAHSSVASRFACKHTCAHAHRVKGTHSATKQLFEGNAGPCFSPVNEATCLSKRVFQFFCPVTTADAEAECERYESVEGPIVAGGLVGPWHGTQVERATRCNADSLYSLAS